MITDLQYPTLDCPLDITYPTEEVFWKDPMPFDFDTQPVVSCTPHSGSTFTSGATTEVKCAADDGEGNTATCRFHVTIGKISFFFQVCLFALFI